jgi:hypothetical protein
MGQIATRTFICTGSAMNLDLGFIPAYAEIRNANATAGEVAKLVYFNLNGDAKEFWEYCINDAGSAVAANITKNTGSGYVTEYDSSTIGDQKGVTFDYTGGAAEDLFTCSNAQDVPSNGDVIKLVESGGLATGLSELLNYYVIDSETYGAGTFRVSIVAPGRGLTQSRVEFSSDGTPSNYFINLSKQEPGNVGGKGLTISASFQADSDVIFVYAVEADTDRDLGDAADW